MTWKILTPKFIPRAKRYNETFLKIFNDSLKQFLTAAASPSNATFASQFPNVLGRNGLVPTCSINLGKDYEHPPYQKLTLHRFESRKELYIRIGKIRQQFESRKDSTRSCWKNDTKTCLYTILLATLFRRNYKLITEKTK